jgi:cytochrome oxidase Cu insertion factor (SCO1/SenC/PrrC family)
MKQSMALVLCACAILVSGCGENAKTAASAPSSAEPMASVPAEPLGDWADFSFKTTAGKPVSLSDYEGKTLLVDVWSYT